MAQIVVVSYFEPASPSTGRLMEMACIALRLQHSIQPIDSPPEDHHPSHFVPWFLMDMLADVEPHSLLFIQPHLRPNSLLARAGMGLDDADIALAYDGDQISLDTMILGNTDITRRIMDTWIERCDEAPDQPAAEILPDVLRRHRSKVSRLPEECLHDLSVADSMVA